MRKALILFAFISGIQTAALAQFPEAGTRNFTFGVNGLSAIGINTNVGHTGSLLFKYYKTDKLAYRFSIGATTADGSTTADNGSGRKTTTTSTNNNYTAAFGLQKNIASVNKFNIYAGADLGLSIKYTKATNRSDVYDSSKAGGQNGDFTQTVTLSPALLKLGVYPCLGVNYFFNPNFSLGAEFSFGLIYGFPSKGTQTITQRVDGTDYPAISNLSSNQGSSFSISGTNGALITCGIYF